MKIIDDFSISRQVFNNINTLFHFRKAFSLVPIVAPLWDQFPITCDESKEVDMSVCVSTRRAKCCQRRSRQRALQNPRLYRRNPVFFGLYGKTKIRTQKKRHQRASLFGLAVFENINVCSSLALNVCVCVCSVDFDFGNVMCALAQTLMHL